MKGETWLIVGAGSAVARAFAHEVAGQGASVVLAGRNRGEMEAQAADLRIRFGVTAHVRDFDAGDLPSHASFVAGIDASRPLNLFYAVGALPDQKAVEAQPALIQSCVDVNFTSAAAFLLALAPVFECQRGGRMVVVGSVAGDRGRPSNYAYGSAKAGLHAFLQGFRARMHRSGVTVTTIKPGFLDTAMTWGLPGLFLVASPEAAARACLAHAARGRETAYVPAFWRLIMAIIQAIPERLFKRLRF